MIELLRSATTDDPAVLFALRERYSHYPAATQLGPERLAELLWRYVPSRLLESQVEAALEALAVEGKVQA